MKNECVIITYGLTDEQNSFIGTCLPTKEYKVEALSDHDETDLIAHRGTVLIINAEKLSENGRKLLWEFYLGNMCTDKAGDRNGAEIYRNTPYSWGVD